jgi:Flp pilus assembly protein TadD
MRAVYATVRLGVLAVLIVGCSLVLGQTNAAGIAPVTSALRAGQFDEALQLLQPELEQQPKNPQLWALRGIALSGEGNKKEALGAFQHALSIAPDYLPALEGAAQID